VTDTDRISLENPNTGKKGLRIRKLYYEHVRAAIMHAIDEAGELRFSQLAGEVEARTPPELWADASVGWYATSVKLDLEAKGLIEKEGSPQYMWLTPEGKAMMPI
jgi:hypothetical protein